MSYTSPSHEPPALRLAHGHKCHMRTFGPMPGRLSHRPPARFRAGVCLRARVHHRRRRGRIRFCRGESCRGLRAPLARAALQQPLQPLLCRACSTLLPLAAASAQAAARALPAEDRPGHAPWAASAPSCRPSRRSTCCCCTASPAVANLLLLPPIQLHPLQLRLPRQRARASRVVAATAAPAARCHRQPQLSILGSCVAKCHSLWASCCNICAAFSARRCCHAWCHAQRACLRARALSGDLPGRRDHLPRPCHFGQDWWVWAWW